MLVTILDSTLDTMYPVMPELVAGSEGAPAATPMYKPSSVVLSTEPSGTASRRNGNVNVPSAEALLAAVSIAMVTVLLQSHRVHRWLYRLKQQTYGQLWLHHLHTACIQKKSELNDFSKLCTDNPV